MQSGQRAIFVSMMKMPLFPLEYIPVCPAERERVGEESRIKGIVGQGTGLLCYEEIHTMTLSFSRTQQLMQLSLLMVHSWCVWKRERKEEKTDQTLCLAITHWAWGHCPEFIHSSDLNLYWKDLFRDLFSDPFCRLSIHQLNQSVYYKGMIHLTN